MMNYGLVKKIPQQAWAITMPAVALLLAGGFNPLEFSSSRTVMELECPYARYGCGPNITKRRLEGLPPINRSRFELAPGTRLLMYGTSHLDQLT